MGLQNPSYYTVIISDHSSPPIAPEICQKLSVSVTDEWEYQGHYVGIALASVISQHYGGHLAIEPLDGTGNEFRLCIPKKLVIKEN